MKMMNDQEQARWTVEDFKFGDVTARVLSDDIGVVAYKVHEEMTVDGKPLSLDAVDASTWIKRDGKMGVCAAHRIPVWATRSGATSAPSTKDAEPEPPPCAEALALGGLAGAQKVGRHRVAPR